MIGDETHLVSRRRAAQAGKRHMRGVFSLLRRKAQALHRALDLALQMEQSVVRRDSGPQSARVLAAERPDAFQFQRKTRRGYRCERLVDAIGIALIDVTNEAQGQVQLLASAPSRAGYAGLHRQ